MFRQKSRNDRLGFTLAEVLITLGIIGVVAALTLPVVIQNYQKQVTVERLKEVYSIFNQAIVNSELDNGDYRDWDYTGDIVGSNFFNKYLKQYLKGVTEVKTDYTYTVKGLDENFSGNFWVAGAEKYALANGMIFSVRVNSYTGVNRMKTGAVITVDINGEKSPNRMGRDVFVMSIFPYNSYQARKLVLGNFELCGSGNLHYLLKRSQLVNEGCGTCNSDHSGYGLACGLLIQLDGWKILNDYPW